MLSFMVKAIVQISKSGRGLNFRLLMNPTSLVPWEECVWGMTVLQCRQEILNASLAKKSKAFHFESLGT